MGQGKNTVGISSSVNGMFNPLGGEDGAGNKWSLSYTKPAKSVTLSINMSTPPILIDNSFQLLHSELALADINQLINWLYHAKVAIQQSGANND